METRTAMEPLLQVKELKTHFQTVRGRVTAVDGVSFIIHKGEILGIVGESGCGKSVTSRSLMRLYDENKSVSHDGSILFEDTELLQLTKREMRKMRGSKLGMIFQDTLSSLNPVFTIGNQIGEAIRRNQKCGRKEVKRRVLELLQAVGIADPAKRINEYPHQLSGGMRQRVMIAMTLASQPKLLIADEPTTALDVTIQAQILNLLRTLQKQMDLSIMLITHDLGVVAEVCTRVVVMYLGQVIEETDVETLFLEPLHPYTQGLINSMPKVEEKREGKLSSIPGTVPTLFHVPKGCRFAGRCKFATEQCLESAPSLVQATETHFVRCWHYSEIKMREGGRNDDVNEKSLGA